jgi:hypothetical protein
MASLPRFPCPVCGRPVAVTERGRLYRHDPPQRPPGPLVSCTGSLKVFRPPERQAVLFHYEPPLLLDDVLGELAGLESVPLF